MIAHIAPDAYQAKSKTSNLYLRDSEVSTEAEPEQDKILWRSEAQRE